MHNQKELSEYEQKGLVVSPVAGAFAEMSPDTCATVSLTSSVLELELEPIQAPMTHKSLLLVEAGARAVSNRPK
jgi:hypothetical protein